VATRGASPHILVVGRRPKSGPDGRICREWPVENGPFLGMLLGLDSAKSGAPQRQKFGTLEASCFCVERFFVGSLWSPTVSQMSCICLLGPCSPRSHDMCGCLGWVASSSSRLAREKLGWVAASIPARPRTNLAHKTATHCPSPLDSCLLEQLINVFFPLSPPLAPWAECLHGEPLPCVRFLVITPSPGFCDAPAGKSGMWAPKPFPPPSNELQANGVFAAAAAITSKYLPFPIFEIEMRRGQGSSRNRRNRRPAAHASTFVAASGPFVDAFLLPSSMSPTRVTSPALQSSQVAELGRTSVRSVRSGRKSPQSCIMWTDTGLTRLPVYLYKAQLTPARRSPMLPREQDSQPAHGPGILGFGFTTTLLFGPFRFLPAPSRSEANDGMALSKGMSLTEPPTVSVKNVFIPSLLKRVTCLPTRRRQHQNRSGWSQAIQCRRRSLGKARKSSDGDCQGPLPAPWRLLAR
jgi:hypothetical protein